MSFKATTIVLIVGLSQLTNASLFGLFSSPKPTRKPDVVVSESSKSESDKNAYQNYLSSLASSYYASVNPPTGVMPVYTYQPQYTSYIQPQQSLIYPLVTVPRILKASTVPYQFNSYQPLRTSVQVPSMQLPSFKFERPITVLPSSAFQESSISSIEKNKESSSLSKDDVTSTVKTLDLEIPEPQISASLYDLPINGISPEFRTGGYITKMMTVSPSDNKLRSGRRFGHAYNNGDGTKVSEDGQLVQYGNGEETVLKRGQYEYIDANGKEVIVKWVADDDGYRLVN